MTGPDAHNAAVACCRLLCARSNARGDVLLMLDRCMAQLVAGCSSTRGYKPRLGRDVTLQELAGAFEVSLGGLTQS